MKNKRIYLDYAATTPLDPVVVKAMRPYFEGKFGNPMSIHSFGQEAQEAVDKSREQVASFLRCDSKEVIFTSGATESNNLAIKGVLKSFYNQKKRPFQKPHIVTTQFEHPCVLNSCKTVEKEGLAEVSYVPVGKEGIVKLTDLKKALRRNTILVSIMYVNNEIGTVQPIKEIGKFLKKKRVGKGYPLFHTDATQAINYFDCHVKNLGVDLLSLSAHKIYGPKGVGALFIKNETPIIHIQDGGSQEYKMRSGTHNVPGIVGLGEAVKILSKKKKSEAAIIKGLRNYLISRVLKEIPNSYLNGSKVKRSPNNANFRFDNVEGEGLVLSLDLERIATSTGSACSSGALEPSHVLLALGLPPEKAHGSLRLTIGRNTTKRDIQLTISRINGIVKRLRKISSDVIKDFK